MLKADALDEFKLAWADLINTYPRLTNDRVAKRESWSNYTDALCKGGEITEKQYVTWSNPF